MSFIFIIVSLLILTGCNNSTEQSGEQSDYIEFLSQVFNVTHPDTVLANTQFQIEVVHLGTESCTIFSKCEQINTDSSVNFNIYCKKGRDWICEECLITLTTDICASLSKKGKNYLLFSSPYGPYLKDSIYVK